MSRSGCSHNIIQLLRVSPLRSKAHHRYAHTSSSTLHLHTRLHHALPFPALVVTDGCYTIVHPSLDGPSPILPYTDDTHRYRSSDSTSSLGTNAVRAALRRDHPSLRTHTYPATCTEPFASRPLRSSLTTEVDIFNGHTTADATTYSVPGLTAPSPPTSHIDSVTPVPTPPPSLVYNNNIYDNRTYIFPTSPSSPPDNSTASQSSGKWWQGESWNAGYAALTGSCPFLSGSSASTRAAQRKSPTSSFK